MDGPAANVSDHVHVLLDPLEERKYPGPEEEKKQEWGFKSEWRLVY